MGDGGRKKPAALIEEENEWLFLKKADNCSAWLEDTIYKGWRMPHQRPLVGQFIISRLLTGQKGLKVE